MIGRFYNKTLLYGFSVNLLFGVDYLACFCYLLLSLLLGLG